MTARAIKIAVMALGGQGGGVLADWIVGAGERAGFIAQSTSVPGVAQRTGATIYYVELFPKAAADERGLAPVLALMPSPGDVDIVIASELMEAGRAVVRGFVSPATTLIASTHRVYAIGEKIALADGRQDDAAVRTRATDAAGQAIWLDMAAAAEEANAVISAVMLGALSGSGAAPFPRAIFEDEIRKSGRAVDRNLHAFALGYDAACGAGGAIKVARASPAQEQKTIHESALSPIRARIDGLPASVRSIAREGARRTIDFQDMRYAEEYLGHLERAVDLDRRSGGELNGFTLARAVAKYLALAMTYDDVIRVADLKTRRARFARVRTDVRAEEGQIIRVIEYMHPRIEEFCDLLPTWVARRVLESKSANSVFGLVLGKGRRVPTSDLGGFLMLSALAALRGVRRSTYRHSVEQARIAEWLALIYDEAPRDYSLAVEIAALQRLIKGYGDTHARGLGNFQRICAELGAVRRSSAPAACLARLRDAALKDEDGIALRAELAKLSNIPQAA